MSGTYKTIGGESWSDVARRTTGNDMDAADIRRANPGVQIPMMAGTALQIPQPATHQDRGTAEELEIRVKGVKLGTVTDFELLLPIDANAKGGFTLPNAKETRGLFAPLSYPRVTVDIFGERVFTGRANTPMVTNSPNEKKLDVTIWADPAILESASPLSDAFPLEWKETTFSEIARHLAGLYGISSNYYAPDKARFARVDIQPGRPVWDFLGDLSVQRGLIIRSDAAGRLFIHDGTGGEIVSYLEEGRHPAGSISPSINDDAYFSSVTVSMPPKSKKGRKGKKVDIQNPIMASSIIRPYYYEARDVDEGEINAVAESLAGRMFAELLSATASLSTWKTDIGTVYQPGQLVTIKAEERYIEEPTQMLISLVTLRKDATSMTAELNLVLPGVYSGEIPEVMPWQR